MVASLLLINFFESLFLLFYYLDRLCNIMWHVANNFAAVNIKEVLLGFVMTVHSYSTPSSLNSDFLLDTQDSETYQNIIHLASGKT